VDADAPFQLFSFRNLIHFLLGFSWTCLSFSNLIQQKTILLTTGVTVGALFVWVFFLIMQQLQKLAEDNSFVFEQTVGLSANVYLTIPAAMQGKGKVLLSVKGSVHELAAMTHNEALPTGTVVIVKHIEAGNILIVDKLA
ncbi:MAG: serine protease, partial [Chitinophagaceae bacterium]